MTVIDRRWRIVLTGHPVFAFDGETLAVEPLNMEVLANGTPTKSHSLRRIGRDVRLSSGFLPATLTR